MKSESELVEAHIPKAVLKADIEARDKRQAWPQHDVADAPPADI